MNRWETSKEAEDELRTTQAISIINEDEEKIYQECLLAAKDRADFINRLRNDNFSEFTIGTIIGMQLTLEGKMKEKKSIKRFIPSLWRH